MADALPDGPRGRIIAVGLTLIGFAVLWIGVAAPLIDWNRALAETREGREALARRMVVVADGLPDLQRRVTNTPVSSTTSRATIEGGTDALAAAALQEQIQEMGRRAGITLSSAEALTVEAVGAYRRIGLRVALEGRWPVLIRFLQAIEQASPSMLVDDLQLQRGVLLAGTDTPLAASFTVFGFRPSPP